MEEPSQESREKSLRFARIRRVKRFLRPLPRRANIHRYPVLSWFKETARKRDYLWSFRRKEAVPALYAGWILTLMPLYGLQIFLAFFLALGVRGNLMILVGLQLVSNPLTVLPIWYVDYVVGDALLGIFFGESPTRLGPILDRASDQGMNFLRTFELIIERTRAQGSGFVTDILGRLVGAIVIGALVLGTVLGAVSSFLYRRFLARFQTIVKADGAKEPGNASS